MEPDIGGQFQHAVGTVIGRDHVLAGKSNQDAHATRVTPEAIVLVVSDGCSACHYSEVGAHLFAELTAEAAHRAAVQWATRKTAIDDTQERFWLQIERDVLSQVRIVARAMGVSLEHVVNEFLLSTVVVAVLTDMCTLVGSVGDGVVSVNGDTQVIGPFANNEPPYLAYGLVDTSLIRLNPDLLHFRTHYSGATDAVESLLIGTDGVADCIARETHALPGRNEVFGPLSQFWLQDRYFANPDMVRRRLVIANKVTPRIDWATQTVLQEPALLHDDTTISVIRRMGV